MWFTIQLMLLGLFAYAATTGGRFYFWLAIALAAKLVVVELRQAVIPRR